MSTRKGCVCRLVQGQEEGEEQEVEVHTEDLNGENVNSLRNKTELEAPLTAVKMLILIF